MTQDAGGAARVPHYARWAAAIALAVVLVTLAMHWGNIANLRFPDVDDELRLVEVRDWLGGQGFYDVSQHRMNPPFGAPMHWSRLVDLPLAAIILALRPLVGMAHATLAAVVLVPLATMAAMLLLVGALARRLAGDRAGLVATALGGMAIAATIQVQPLRVDHHGWEIVFALVATLGLLMRDARRGGMIAGLGIAVALQISLEALPYAVALGGVAALLWARDPDRRARDRLRSYILALAIGEAALFALFRRIGDLGGYCDAVSPPQLIGLGLAAAGIMLATVRRWTPAGRALALALAGGVAAIGFRAMPPHCGADAFAALEPIVRHYWLDQVNEGLPVWRQTPLIAAATIGFPLIGLACAAVAWRIERREAWAIQTLLLLAACAVAIDVQRAGGFANMLALPAATWAMLALVARVQRSRIMPVRVLGSVAVVAALSPLAPSMAVSLLPIATDPPGAARSQQACNALPAVHRLDALPAARMLAPLDLGPAILLVTRHAILASGHHRNHAAIADELRAWLGSDDAAHAVVRRHGLDYVLLCPGLSEMRLYRRAAPDGFDAHLVAGRVPGWLTPVTLPGSPIRLWRVTG